MSRHSLTLAAASIACLLAALPAAAQDKEPEFITDRPDFTESSTALPRGYFQIESGFTWTDESGKGGHTFSLPELLLRYSVAERTELRLGTPDFIRSGRSGKHSNLFGDTFLGVKQQLVSSDKPYGLAILPAVTLPTGSGGASSGAIDPELFLAWSKELGGRWSVAGLLGGVYAHEGNGRTFHFEPTVSFSYGLGKRVDTFFEWAADFPSPGADSHLFHHGYSYALNGHSQVDLHIGVGLTRAAPDLLIGGGYAIRF